MDLNGKRIQRVMQSAQGTFSVSSDYPRFQAAACPAANGLIVEQSFPAALPDDYPSC